MEPLDAAISLVSNTLDVATRFEPIADLDDRRRAHTELLSELAAAERAKPPDDVQSGELRHRQVELKPQLH
jgi:hypothetical protein